jgi:hypothetical protein
VLGNAGTIISFRVGAEDASYLEHEFQEPFDRTDLAHLANHRIYISHLYKDDDRRNAFSDVRPRHKRPSD